MEDKKTNEQIVQTNAGNAGKTSAKANEMSSVDKAGKKLAYSTDLKPAEGGSKGNQRDSRGPKGRRPMKSEGEASGLIESVIRISRVAKVTKGGTKMSFSALVVVGDGKGRVGYALGKAGEVAVGIKKAMNAAKKRMVEINRRGTTIPHQVIGSWCATRVMLKPAADGTGVIASGPVRAICDGAGIKNILTKVHRSRNPLNVVKATFEGLARLKKAPAANINEVKEIK